MPRHCTNCKPAGKTALGWRGGGRVSTAGLALGSFLRVIEKLFAEYNIGVSSGSAFQFRDVLEIPALSAGAGSIPHLGFLDVIADVLLRRCRQRGRVDNVHHALEDGDDGGFVHVEPFFEFRLQCSQLARQFAVVGQRRAHFHEGAHDENVHVHGALAAQDTGQHRYAVFGECERSVLEVMPAL